MISRTLPNRYLLRVLDEVFIAIVGIGKSWGRYLFMVGNWDSLDLFNGGGVIGTPVKKRRFHLF